MSQPKGTILIENANTLFHNFAGKEGMYNREGDRNFCVLLDEDLAKELDKDGWNVKALRSREEGDPERPYLQVSVSFRNRPPKVVMITSKGRTDLGEGEIELLDWVEISQIDLIIRPYTWEVGGKGGIKAYLKSLFVTIEEDALDLKYADVPEIGSSDYVDAEVVSEHVVREISFKAK